MGEPSRKIEQGASVSASASQRVLNPRAFTRAVNRAIRQTDENYHTEALQTFTRHFKYNDLTKELNQIHKEHLAAGSLTQDLWERRSRVMNELENRVRRDYGEDVLRRVRQGL